jgi:hypothetical protein
MSFQPSGAPRTVLLRRAGTEVDRSSESKDHQQATTAQAASTKRTVLVARPMEVHAMRHEFNPAVPGTLLRGASVSAAVLRDCSKRRTMTHCNW